MQVGQLSQGLLYRVLRQGCIDGFSWPVGVRGKAPLAVMLNASIQS